jgi:hypothetical protein
MDHDAIQEGFEVFVSDTSKPFGAVRRISRHGGGEMTVYVENGGDFTVPFGAVKAVHSQKVIVDPSKLDSKLQRAIRHAHDAEDPRI